MSRQRAVEQLRPGDSLGPQHRVVVLLYMPQAVGLTRPEPVLVRRLVDMGPAKRAYADDPLSVDGPISDWYDDLACMTAVTAHTRGRVIHAWCPRYQPAPGFDDRAYLASDEQILGCTVTRRPPPPGYAATSTMPRRTLVLGWVRAQPGAGEVLCTRMTETGCRARKASGPDVAFPLCDLAGWRHITHVTK